MRPQRHNEVVETITSIISCYNDGPIQPAVLFGMLECTVLTWLKQKKSSVVIIFVVQVRLGTEVLGTPSLTQLGFKLMTSRSWQYISCHWDACSNHSAISDFYYASQIRPDHVIILIFDDSRVSLLATGTGTHFCIFSFPRGELKPLSGGPGLPGLNCTSAAAPT